MGNELNVDELKEKLKVFLTDYAIKADVKSYTSGRGNVYAIKTKEAKMEITLSDSWIGYELFVNKNILGKDINIFEDTDNYPLGGEYKDVSMDIFNETLLCAKALLDRNIYVGKIKSKPIIAIPQPSGTYKVIQRGRIISSEKLINKSGLKQATDLRTLN